MNIYEEVKDQLSGTAIGRRFAPTYASIFMGKIETNLLDMQEFKLFISFQYIDDISLFGHVVKKNWKSS